MLKIKDILISIVIPVYNSEKFLSRCIDSIICQKTDLLFEAIFVNDGSTDNSLNILKNKQALDKRIVIIDQPNAGVSAARNAGIKHSKGRFVAFIDSDDWIEPSYLQNLYNALDQDKTCLIIEGCIQETTKGTKINRYENGIYECNQFNRMFRDRRINVKGVPWGKLYDLSIIKKNNLGFEIDLMFCEDFIFMLNYLFYVDKVIFIDATDYHYVKQSNSLVSRFYSFEKEYLGFVTIKNVFDKLATKYDVVEFKCWSAFLALRSIRTIYRPGINYLSSKRRIQCLKKFTKDDIGILSIYSKLRDNILGRIVALGLRMKTYRILDFTLWTLITLRK